MTFIGIDDTDTIDSPGTNQLARAIAKALTPAWHCEWILRHQLLDDPRVPYTSKNGSASLLMQRLDGASIDSLTETCRAVMREWFIEGSDPGLCVSEEVPPEVTEFGRRCKTALISQADARDLAARHRIYLEGLGGTEGGVIGALAAVGLAASGDDGRFVQIGHWPDDLFGTQPVQEVRNRGVRLHDIDNDCDVEEGIVDLGKRLRPNRWGGQPVLFVQRDPVDMESRWFKAMKLP